MAQRAAIERAKRHGWVALYEHGTGVVMGRGERGQEYEIVVLCCGRVSAPKWWRRS